MNKNVKKKIKLKYYCLVGCLVCFTAYQPPSGHLMPNQVVLKYYCNQK